jgi:hypothetical protein
MHNFFVNMDAGQYDWVIVVTLVLGLVAQSYYSSGKISQIFRRR